MAIFGVRDDDPTPSDDRPTRRGVGRPKGDTKFDVWARIAFLNELADTGRFYDSAEAAGVNYTTMKSFRAGGDREDLAFEEEVQVALECYRDKLRSEVHRRGVEGWVERGIYDKDGGMLGHVVKFSDRLLELHVKRHDPSYREKLDVTAQTKNENTNRTAHSLDVEKLLRGLSKEGRAALRTLLAAMAPADPPDPGKE